MAAGSYRQLVPGRRFLVKFGEDPGFVHERVCLWPLSSAIQGGPVASCAIVTPHGDVYEEAVADYRGFTLVDNDASEYPEAFCEDQEIVQFPSPLENKDLLAEIQAARQRARASLGTRHPAKPPTQWMAWNGVLKDLPPLKLADNAAGRAGTAAALPRPAHDVAPDEPEPPERRHSRKSGDKSSFQWVVSEPGWEINLGEVLGLPSGSVVGGDRGVANHPRGWIPVAKIPHGTAKEFVAELRDLWSKPDSGEEEKPKGDAKSLRKKLGLDDDVDAPAPAGDLDEEEDVRTLKVDYDDQDVRYKAWREVCSQSRVHTYPDFPLDGPISCLDLCKHMHRFGGDPANWMLQFTREKHIAPSDRTWHELRTLTSALNTAGCYDQLNLGASGALEVICRRIQAIADAHQIPGKVDWSNGRFFAGVGDVGDAVTSNLRQWAARKAKDEAEIESARDRARALQNKIPSASSQEHAPPKPPAPKAKKKGKLGPGAPGGAEA